MAADTVRMQRRAPAAKARNMYGKIVAVRTRRSIPPLAHAAVALAPFLNGPRGRERTRSAVDDESTTKLGRLRTSKTDLFLPSFASVCTRVQFHEYLGARIQRDVKTRAFRDSCVIIQNFGLMRHC